MTQHFGVAPGDVDHLTRMFCDDGVEFVVGGEVVSENGLGIGLYQAARWAEQLGFHLELVSDQAGKVCFELHDGY